ncbi:MAG: hypothetical protein LIQ31_05195 [Planctomycetes bacterium]|nr:hypothetical protein [Planctomycetota bacterium]
MPERAMEEYSESRPTATYDYANLLAPPSTRPDFTTGWVLSRTWKTFMNAPALYIGLALIPAIPSYFGSIVDETVAEIALSLVESCFSLFIQAAVAYAVYRSMCGESSTAGESLAKGLKRFFPVLIASIIVGGLTAVGYILLVIPGLILTCIFIVTIPVCVVEQSGPLDSLQRSSVLTKEYRWSIFFLLAFIVAVTTGLSLAVTPIVLFIPNSGLYTELIVHIVLLIPIALKSVMTAVIYYTLREVKEGVSVENLANVFD